MSTTITSTVPDSISRISALVEEIARFITDEPEQIKVIVTKGSRTVILEIAAAPNDICHLIGKNGQMAKAIKTIVIAAAKELGINFQVKILV